MALASTKLYISASILLLATPSLSQAQQALIKGLLVDKETGSPISSASSALLQQSNKSYVKGAQSLDNGSLTFTDLAAGTYAVRISYVGYESILKENITVKSGQQLDLGKIVLSPSGELLAEVLVEGRAPAMQIGVDRKIFNVAQSMVSVGGTASDLLANVPTLQVDMDGAVQLRGSTSVKILIDGKESAMAGSNITALLQSMPANSIERVEIITNPSSKYDAEGQSGIVNIVLKKNIRTGLNGTANVSAGSYNNYQAGIALNYRDNKVNYFGNYTYNRRNMVGDGKRNNTYSNGSQINNNTESSRKTNSHTVKVGVDYYLDAKTTLGLSSNISLRDNNRDQDIFYNYLNHPIYTGTSTRLSRQQEDDFGYDLNLDFKREFKRQGEELVANISIGKDKEDGTNNFDQTFSDPSTLSSARYNTTSEKGKVMNFQVDYSLPFSEDKKFEAGYRSIVRNSRDYQLSNILNPTTGEFEPDYNLSNGFDLKSSVHALYANFQNKLSEKISYQVGLRAEQAYLNSIYWIINPMANSINITGGLNYFRLYPTAFLTYALGDNNDKLQLSYSRRVNRPRGWQINPFIDVSDESNYRQGNPNLLPEDIHSFELNYAKVYTGWNFISTAYYRKTNDMVQPYIYEVNPETSVTYSRWENLTDASAYGIELISKIDISRNFDLMANLNFTYNQILGSETFQTSNQNGLTWNGNLTANYKFTPTFSTQIRGDYFAPRVMAQGKTIHMAGLDIALKKDVLKSKGSIMLNVRDVFNGRKFGATTDAGNVISYFENRWSKRMITLSFSYRFGLQDSSKQKARETQAQDMGGEGF
ncbi:TonB-dependent receptor [Sphingobacteriaceae bacterium WQ 2009]|uniref:TonB-dependent receptor n=1 Tax=Rhinopithecimicrobium faecis TaxID=2820698 RepID=A0A8T4HCR4_9SPHI|nr:TonB-dependent receptor [Sphingobacteriaceae bacterium WQ 2009]